MRRSIGLVCLALLTLGADVPGHCLPVQDPGTMTNEQGCTRKRGGPQDPSATPPPLMDACLGPYLLHVPANYFDDQMGPYFDGSFGLALEYPGLNAFKPGERSHLSLDVSLRTISIEYSYVDRGSPEDVLLNSYTPQPYEEKYPEKRLDTRIKGDPIYGLTPYYADVNAYTKAFLARNKSITPNVRIYKDWFFQKDGKGKTLTFIQCTSRDAANDNVALRNGKWASTSNDFVPSCDQIFIIPEKRIVVRINYVRFGLADWDKFQKKARQLLDQFSAGTTLPGTHRTSKE